MTKKIEILIVVAVLFVLAFVFGCKKRVDPVEFTIETAKTDAYLENNEPKTYTAEELDEIYKNEPALGRLAKDLYGVGEGRLVWKKELPEPNEPMKYSLSIPT